MGANVFALRRSTILADARLRGGFGALSRSPLDVDSVHPVHPVQRGEDASLVRVGSFEWPNMQLPPQGPRSHLSHLDRPTRAATPRTRVGADTDSLLRPWTVVSTDFSRLTPETKAAIPVGSVVRFTVQRQLGPIYFKTKEDSSEMAILRGRVVAPRSPLMPDSYAVQVIETVSTHELDPSVSPPATNQVFLVAPESVGSVESVGSEAPPTLVIPSTSEFVGQLLQAGASVPPAGWTIPPIPSVSPATPAPETATTVPAAAPTVTPSTAAGTADSVATAPAGFSGTSIAIGIGLLIVAGAGFLYWRFV